MVREIIGYYNNSFGEGFEGFLNYTNNLSDNWLVPLFLMVFYGLSIYVLSKSEWKLGGVVFYSSFVFFLLAMIFQTFTTFNQMIIFIFAIGIGAGIVLSFIENAK
jgi:hypothetical protein